MVGNLAKWPSERGPVTKIMPSDGCGENFVASTVVHGYDPRKLGVIWELSVWMPVLAMLGIAQASERPPFPELKAIAAALA